MNSKTTGFRLLALMLMICLVSSFGCGGSSSTSENGDAGDNSTTEDGGDTTPTDTEKETETETDTESNTQDTDTTTSCVSGTVNCECDEGVCNEGECIEGQCVDCLPGDDECVCKSSDVCNGGLRCTDGICETCPPGEANCACTEEDACDGELVCTNGVCAEPTCEVGSDGCPCRDEDSDPRCDNGGYCNENGICSPCSTDVDGCPCEDSACAEGFECSEEDICKEIITCEVLVAKGLCGEHQVCNEEESGSQCVEGSCEQGYIWDENASDCLMKQECDLGITGSIAEVCLSENRECTNAGGNDACGACLDGFVEEDGKCIGIIVCGDDGECASNEYCDRFVPDGMGGLAPECKTVPCTKDNEVMDASGNCVSCTGTCTAEGNTGRFWPFHDAEDNCVCETMPDFYNVSGGGRVPERCDADYDGWVRDDLGSSKYSSEFALNNSSEPTKQTMAQNARCDIRWIDRVVLTDEYGVSATVWSCDGDKVDGGGLYLQQPADSDSGSPCTDPHPMALLESERNDKPDNAQILGDDSLIYGGDDGRHLRADEMNALTKGCTSLNGDFNDNQTNDIKEMQGTPEDTSVLKGSSRLASFSYFIELYRAHFQKPGFDDDFGALVIEERSRCNSDLFVLGYDEDTTYSSSRPASYWRNCYRRRDPGYNGDNKTTGFDFAQFTCGADERSGSCAAAPPAHATFDASDWDSSKATIRQHGLCEMEAAPPKDATWRGMNHHSQFKCIRVEAANPTDVKEQSYKKDDDDFGADKLFIYNDCHAKDCGDSGSCTFSRVVEEGQLDSRDPIIKCTALTNKPAIGSIGFASVNYKPYLHQIADDTNDDGLLELVTLPGSPNAYLGGCVNEDAEWGYLCSYPEYGALGAAPLDAFGRYHCYCWEGMFLWAPDNVTGICSGEATSEDCTTYDCVDCSGDGTEDCFDEFCDWSSTQYNQRSSLIWAADGVVGSPNQSQWAPDEPDTSSCSY